jgi:hypothetical protein
VILAVELPGSEHYKYPLRGDPRAQNPLEELSNFLFELSLLLFCPETTVEAIRQ